MSDQIRLEITFTSGETISYQPEQWDDYAYDGKAVIVKLRGAWVASITLTRVLRRAKTVLNREKLLNTAAYDLLLEIVSKSGAALA